MASILVQYKKSGKYRMWNNTVDCWETPIMPKLIMFIYLTRECQHSEKEAVERIERIGYTLEHIKFLETFYDSKVSKLQKMHRKNSGAAL